MMNKFSDHYEQPQSVLQFFLDFEGKKYFFTKNPTDTNRIQYTRICCISLKFDRQLMRRHMPIQSFQTIGLKAISMSSFLFSRLPKLPYIALQMHKK